MQRVSWFLDTSKLYDSMEKNDKKRNVVEHSSINPD